MGAACSGGPGNPLDPPPIPSGKDRTDLLTTLASALQSEYSAGWDGAVEDWLVRNGVGDINTINSASDKLFWNWSTRTVTAAVKKKRHTVEELCASWGVTAPMSDGARQEAIRIEKAGRLKGSRRSLFVGKKKGKK